jgi:anti-sigma B factor antagonist
MQVEERHAGDVRILSIADARVDARSAPALKESVAAVLSAGTRKIVLDLGRVEFVDSTGLGVIVSCLKQVGRGGEFVIASCSQSVATLFRLTRMDKVFRVFASTDEAVHSLQTARGE